MKRVKMPNGQTIPVPSHEGWHEDFELESRQQEAFLAGECDLLEVMDSVDCPFTDY
jgi:hypothetical protein